MSELVFWKPAVQESIEEIESRGHRLNAFDPKPPDILPSDADFYCEATCQRCDAFVHVGWSPFDTEGLTAHGSALEQDCAKKSLRQPAA
jgi:hypothetical protein